MANIRLGEILTKQGLVKPDKLARAIEEQRKSGAKLSHVIVQMGLLKENQILKALESHFQMPGVDLGNFEIQKAAMAMVPREVCEKHMIIPVQKVGANTLVVAMSDPSNMYVRDDLRFLTKCKIQTVVATEIAISSAIEKIYGVAQVQGLSDAVEKEARREEESISGMSTTSIVDLGDSETEEGPIVKFVNGLLQDAIRRRASDIHFEPYEKRYRVRFRVDGNMLEAASPPVTSGPAIASRIKIMSKLDISEKRRPQDGRIKLRLSNGKDMDFRVSVMPTMFGEKVVMRLLDKTNLQLDMTKLGLETDDLQIFKEIIQRPQGLILITGPTGSGKTTTIYSALFELNQPDVNISTAEDPVEFHLEGINQVQINADIGFTFAMALKAFLRQDPDVIMVGEIRDLETAEISMKAASTGHLVVSTLHTNDAAQTVARLTEMGVAPYIVTSTVTLIVAQRLVGRICESCKAPFDVPPTALINLGVPAEEVSEYKLYRGKGCAACNGMGIRGRIAIFEVLRMTEPMKEAILRNASAQELRVLAREEGMRTLRRSALLKLKRGETTIEEVLNSSIKDS